MVGEKTIAAGTATVAIAGLAAVGAKSPEGFWPVTVIGWLTMATSVGTLITLLYLLYKKSLSPVVGSIEHVEKHFDKKIEELEKKYDGEFERQIQLQKEQMDAFTRAVHERLNGMGLRIDEHRVAIGNIETDYEVINRLMAASIEDRRHINIRLDRIDQGQDKIINMLLNINRGRS